MERPLMLLIAALIGSIITLIVTIAINATIANDPYNDLGENTGWALLMPFPAISFVWTLIDLALYRFGFYHPIYWLVTSTLLACGYFATGGLGLGFYYWDDAGSWVAGMFLIFMGVFYIISMTFASIAVHKHRKQHKPLPSKDFERMETGQARVSERG